MNTFIIAANLGQNAEVKIIREKSYLTFSVAENQRIVNKETGEIQTVANWYNVLYRGGENLQQYLVKGQKVLVVGELTIDVFKSETAGVRVGRSIFASRLELLGSSQKEDNAEQKTDHSWPGSSVPNTVAGTNVPPTAPIEPGSGDDLPF